MEMKSQVGKLGMSSLLTFVRDWTHLLDDFSCKLLIYATINDEKLQRQYVWPKLKDNFSQLISSSGKGHDNKIRFQTKDITIPDGIGSNGWK